MTPCWLWKASRVEGGYGQIVRGGRHYRAHRYIYELLVGDIPTGMQLDHLCRQRSCVNPDHLRLVTNRENVFAPGSKTRTKANAEKTHCLRGHEFTAENTETRRNGGRRCRECHRTDENMRYRSGRKIVRGQRVKA